MLVINEAAAHIGDPLFRRISADEWLSFQNQSSRDLCRKLRLKLWTSVFDTVLNESEYSLPDDCLQVKSLRYNATPSDPTTAYWLTEAFEDEYRSLTDRTVSVSQPLHYFVLTQTFFLSPIPDATVVGGGKIQYWGMPDNVTSPVSENIPVADFLRDTLRERMLIYGWRRLEKWDSAAAAESEWQASLATDRDRLEDRSADRRPRIRTRPGNIFGQR